VADADLSAAAREAQEPKTSPGRRRFQEPLETVQAIGRARTRNLQRQWWGKGPPRRGSQPLRAVSRRLLERNIRPMARTATGLLPRAWDFTLPSLTAAMRIPWARAWSCCRAGDAATERLASFVGLFSPVGEQTATLQAARVRCHVKQKSATSRSERDSRGMSLRGGHGHELALGRHAGGERPGDHSGPFALSSANRRPSVHTDSTFELQPSRPHRTPPMRAKRTGGSAAAGRCRERGSRAARVRVEGIGIGETSV